MFTEHPRQEPETQLFNKADRRILGVGLATAAIMGIVALGTEHNTEPPTTPTDTSEWSFPLID